MPNRVLIIAFHFPPLVGTSGVQRAFSVAKHLPDFDWSPIVLTANERAYERTGPDLLDGLPSDLNVERAFALDSARHLSISGRYPDFFARPDRWVTWWPFAVHKGLALIRTHRPQLIWSTYPIATANLVGMSLHKRTGLPWIADFRDSMTDANYPADPKVKELFKRIEKRTIESASYVVFTSPGALEMYAERYPSENASKWRLIRNGYDEDVFALADIDALPTPIENKAVVLHSGTIYPKERDPTDLFRALSNLKRSGVLNSDSLELRLRATGHDEILRKMVDEFGIGDIVSILGPVDYRTALAEMASSSGLLLLQAASCNHQTPAKLYEYIRAGRPILALTDERGDTAKLLKSMEFGHVAPLDSATRIESAIRSFLCDLKSGIPELSDPIVSSFSRHAQVGELADLLNSISVGHRK